MPIWVRNHIRAFMSVVWAAVCLAPLVTPNSHPPHSKALIDLPNAKVSLNAEVPFEVASTEKSPITCRNSIQDVGLVMGGKEVRADFVVENETDQPVWIHILEACACLRPCTIRCIEPHQSTVVQVSISTKPVLGRFTKTIQVRQIDQPPNAMEILANAPHCRSNPN